MLILSSYKPLQYRVMVVEWLHAIYRRLSLRYLKTLQLLDPNAKNTPGRS